jgi:LPXTG-motif cell wall-anchored protein
MSALTIILIIVAGLVLLGLLGGYLATRRREHVQGGDFERHVAEADRALATARSADKGWDRARLEDAARSALTEAQPGAGIDELHLVLVDDRPGVEEDRAHFVAIGPGGERRVVLCREGDTWVAERVE